MATFRVAGASDQYLAISGWGVDNVKLAKKAWVWLGQRCTTLDAAPASYELEAHAVTSNKFPVVFRAVYTTVGLNTKIDAGGKGNKDPLLLLLHGGADDKLAAPRRRRCNKKLVNGVVEGRVRSLAATMTTEQICAKGSTSFAKEVLESARLDLAKYGLRVCNAADESLAVNMPANKLSMVVVDEDIRAAPATKTRTGLCMQVSLCENDSTVEAYFPEKPGDAVVVGAATKKKDNKQRNTVFGVGVHVQMEVEGKNDMLLRLTKKFKQPEQFTSKAAAAVASDGAKVEELKYGGQKAAAEYLATKMKEIAGGLRAIKEDVTMDDVTKRKAAEERLQAAEDFLGKNVPRPTDTQVKAAEECKASDDLLEELLAKAEHAATDLQALAGKIRAFKVHMKVEFTNIQRLKEKVKAVAANGTQADSNKVDVEATEAILEHATTRMKELAGDIGTIMDHVAMDIKDAAEVAKPVTGSLEAEAEVTKAIMEVMPWYLS